MDIKKNNEKTIPIKLTSSIAINTISFTKKAIANTFTPQRFICQTPINDIKLAATINPNNAGYQSPSFFTDGENTPIKPNIIQIKPKMHTMVSNTGRFLIVVSILKS